MSTFQISQDKVQKLAAALNQIVIGCEPQIETICCALLARGHVSALGEPGTAKTLTMKGIAWIFDGSAKYHREQLVSDTMPADLLGANVFVKELSKFKYRFGPLNPKTNFFHADEINRTTPKTQSALLQAMEENAISLPTGVRNLHDVFMVLATRNPIDLEGTYPLPAAQLDRFAAEIVYDRLNEAEELDVVDKTTSASSRHGIDASLRGILQLSDIPEMREAMRTVHCSREVKQYAVKLGYATRPGVLKELDKYFLAGVSVRAAQWLVLLAQARAFFHGRDYVKPDDVKALAKPVLRHRLYLTQEKLLRNVKPDDVIQQIVDLVPIVKS
ncbi:MAG: MoxR family ATPase [Candidatus Melainabacteria bacterium]|nr:MoxR family ATPase [Candidatus Melainabacteria bacterium]